MGMRNRMNPSSISMSNCIGSVGCPCLLTENTRRCSDLTIALDLGLCGEKASKTNVNIRLSPSKVPWSGVAKGTEGQAASDTVESEDGKARVELCDGSLSTEAAVGVESTAVIATTMET